MWLALIAIWIGIAVIALEQFLFSLLTGRPIGFAPDVGPVQALLAAIPFLILALIGARTLLPWIVGLALTFAFYGYVLFEGVSYQWNPDGSGANIGLGILAIFVVPPFISAACIAAYALGKRSRAGERSTPVSEGGRSLGCLAALVVGALTVVLVHGTSSILIGEPLNLIDGWPIFLFQMLVVAMPFGLLALAGIRSSLPWLVGLILTLISWSSFVFEVVSIERNPDHGVNFDVAMIAFASPFIITLACFGVHAWQRRKKTTGN